MGSELEKQLEQARLRNTQRLVGKPKQSKKRRPRWVNEVSDAHLERLSKRLNKRLAHTTRVVELNKRQYRHGTGRPKGLKQYGLTRESWLQLVDKQESKCAICGKEELHPSALAIDHDHKTGRVRGLLCRDCNVALGLLRDDVDLLAKATLYLTQNTPG